MTQKPRKAEPDDGSERFRAMVLQALEDGLALGLTRNQIANALLFDIVVCDDPNCVEH